ncbi:hypothetical protein CRM96_09890 [Enterococcus durans]|uniref:Uncharacterized protein n=1 Tax=Enterococcus durans TaxID=53345 RepID=A0AB36S9A4_9ENTE|nr:hypothetical protein [Enterococcus durans]MDB1684713.1 hypothetical protein [Enterococcus durans]PEH45303.1 hypothetical protein CRM96_09890 [Enterococcus durans]RSL37428.1 hypothetical protein B7758_02120 [Enterococcus durans]
MSHIRVSAYFRRSCFCSNRLFVFKEWDKSKKHFCPTLSLFISHQRFRYRSNYGLLSLVHLKSVMQFLRLKGRRR